mgnify:CR=1 FL=1
MNVAILGATGAVGREMMKILAERSFPWRSCGCWLPPLRRQKLLWQGRELTVQPAEDSAFEGMDIVLGAAENDIAKRSPRPSLRQVPCSWTTPAPSAWTPMCRW